LVSDVSVNVYFELYQHLYIVIYDHCIAMSKDRQQLAHTTLIYQAC